MPFTPSSTASHAACIRGLEPNGHAAFRGQQHVIIGLGPNHPDQGVAVVEVQSDKARAIDVFEFGESRAFDPPASGGKEQITTRQLARNRGSLPRRAC